MRLRNGSTLGLLASFTIGAGVTLGMMNNYTPSDAPASTQVNVVSETDSPTPSPTESVTPTPTATSTAVEGDDGSLGGPVLNSANQATPTYIYKSPAPTHEDANDDTAAVETPAVVPTHTATSEVTQRPPTAPEVSKTPSPDDHSETPAP